MKIRKKIKKIGKNGMVDGKERMSLDELEGKDRMKIKEREMKRKKGEERMLKRLKK